MIGKNAHDYSGGLAGTAFTDTITTYYNQKLLLTQPADFAVPTKKKPVTYLQHARV
jgi:hypothetical protein